VESSKIRLVVNRYDSNLGLDREAIATALNSEILQTLPNDVDAIQKSLLEGKPVLTNTPLGKALSHLADKLAGERKPDAKRQSLLSGIFSVFDGVLHKG
jgi:Flp pilus assembly CpaE family ATPase